MAKMTDTEWEALCDGCGRRRFAGMVMIDCVIDLPLEHLVCGIIMRRAGQSRACDLLASFPAINEIKFQTKRALHAEATIALIK